MDNLNLKEPILRPHPQVEDRRNRPKNKIRWILQNGINDISVGVHLSIQFLALLISSVIEDIPSICISSIFILITQGGLVKCMKPSSIKIVRRLTLFVVILGATLASSYAWRIYRCKNVYDYCTTYHTSRETLEISTFLSCQWLIHQVFIEYCMVFCGVWMVVSNGVILLFRLIR